MSEIPKDLKYANDKVADLDQKLDAARKKIDERTEEADALRKERDQLRSNAASSIDAAGAQGARLPLEAHQGGALEAVARGHGPVRAHELDRARAGLLGPQPHDLLVDGVGQGVEDLEPLAVDECPRPGPLEHLEREEGVALGVAALDASALAGPLASHERVRLAHDGERAAGAGGELAPDQALAVGVPDRHGQRGGGGADRNDLRMRRQGDALRRDRRHGRPSRLRRDAPDEHAGDCHDPHDQGSGQQGYQPAERAKLRELSPVFVLALLRSGHVSLRYCNPAFAAGRVCG